MERIFLYLCNVSSEIVSIEAIAKELNGVSRPTVENYIEYLESANLIYQSWPVNMAGKKVLKASPKIYIADAAIRNAVLMDDSMLSDPVEMGKVVETAVYKHVAAFYYQQAASVGYYRGGKRGKEIDVVVEYSNSKNILIEVKYRDGAFIMQKKRRTDNTALLDIVGRDQPDQELTLEFNRERCVWEFQGAETELWKLPPDPLLEAVAKVLTPEQPEWSGTPTELLERLPGVGIQANILTRKLNVSADRLYNDYGIRYESRRTHEGRVVKLMLENSGA